MLKTIRIDNVLGGASPLFYLSGDGQFLESSNINPEATFGSVVRVPSGILYPSGCVNIDSGALTGAPRWIIANPVNDKSYVYAADEKVYEVDSSYAFTNINAPTTGSVTGHGMAYYKDYIYIAAHDDLHRYGRLSGTPSWSTDWWTGLGLGGLEGSEYPVLNRQSIELPNHPMFVHPNDAKLYFGDVTSAGVGQIHYVKTDDNGGDDTSTYGALDFQEGLWPTALERYQDFLVIALYDGRDGKNRDESQYVRHAGLAFWDKAAASWNLMLRDEIPGDVITAMKNVNGQLYLFVGNTPEDGYEIYRYAGGYSVQRVARIPEGDPPMQSAVDSIGDQLVWGSYETTLDRPCVYALGTRDGRLSKDGLFNIMATTSAGSNGVITALAHIDRRGTTSTNTLPMVGWKDDADQGIDRGSTTSGDFKEAIWRSQMFRIGQPFEIKRLRFHTPNSVDVGRALTVTAYFDGGTKETILATITDAAPWEDRTAFKLETQGANGDNDFFLQFNWPDTCTAEFPVALPITIDIDIHE